LTDNSHDSGELPKRTDGPALHDGLPVSGFGPVTGEAVNLVNVNKDVEERILRILDDLADRHDVDRWWLAIGRTDIERGFMAINRAVFQPARVELADDTVEETGWLIELASRSPSAPIYFAPNCVSTEKNWSASPMRAIRFARREDAEALATYLVGDLNQVRIVEHRWCAS